MRLHATLRSFTEARRAPGVVAFALALAALHAGGCASAARGPSGAGEARSTAPAFAQALERQARRQEERPDRHAMSAPIPPGIDEALVAPVAPDDPRARQSLTAALGEVTRETAANWGGGGEPAEEPEETSADDRDGAVRRYIAGRSLLQSGDAVGAAAEFEAATKLDPGAPEPWRELGVAHLTRGDRLAGVAAFRQALQRDPTDETSLVRVGLAALDRRDAALAAHLLGRAWTGLSESSDPALTHVVGVGLGRSLHREGWLAAGNEAMRSGLDGLHGYSQPTVYVREISDVLRESSDAWRDVGDASCRLEEWSDAVEAYRLAAGLPSFDPGALAPRRALAAMRAGRPAEAALLVLGDVVIAQGRADERTLRLIEYVRVNSAAGPALASALEGYAQSLSPDALRAAAGPLARARAAALPRERAIETLFARLEQAPTDDAAVSDLLNQVGREDAGALVSATQRLIAMHPAYEGRFSGALLRHGPEPARLLGALDAQGGASESGPLRARLLNALGRTDEAEATLRAALARRPDDIGALIALVELLVSRGRTEEALVVVERLRATADRVALYAQARALRAMGRAAAALEAIEPAVFSPDATAEEALLAGQLMAELGRAADAQQMLEIAIDLDPSMEEAYAGLIALHQPGGPLPDAPKLSDALRALRAAAPSSRTIRWLRAQDLLRAGRFDQAERELIGLAEESPDDAVTEALVGLWIRTGSTERAMEWLGRRMAARPGDTALVVQTARVLAAGDRPEEAITLLRAALAERPQDARLSRELETILRSDAVDRGSEADEIALARLRAAAPSFDRAIELAQVHLRRDEVQEAAAVLVEPIRGGGVVAPARLAQAFGETWRGVARRALQVAQERPEALAGAVAMMRTIIQTQPGAPPEAYGALIAMMVRAGFTPAQVAEAAAQAARAHPDRGGAFYLEGAQWFMESGSGAGALALLEAGAFDPGRSPSVDLLEAWFKLALREMDSEQAQKSLRRMVEVGAARAVAERMLTKAPGGPDAAAAAELAYETAQALHRAEREAEGDRLYALALEFNPRHAMANNNLGYRIADEGGDLAEAHRMLTIAYEESPADASIVDSLGWVRYKMGVFDDRAGDGAPPLEGAVTLLSRAADLATRDQEGAAVGRLLNLSTIWDHLGDALWRASRPEDALAAWQRAEGFAREFEGVPDLNEAGRAEGRRILTGVESKIRAAASGAPPVVSPLPGDSPATPGG